MKSGINNGHIAGFCSLGALVLCMLAMLSLRLSLGENVFVKKRIVSMFCVTKKNWEYRRRIMDDNILDIIFLYIHICSQIMTMLKVPKGAVCI